MRYKQTEKVFFQLQSPPAYITENLGNFDPQMINAYTARGVQGGH